MGQCPRKSNKVKVNITVRGPVFNGFLNLDPTATQQDQDRVLCDLQNFDSLLDNNEAEQILVNDILDYIPLPARPKVLSSLLTKVAHDGEVVVTGLDLHEMARVVYDGECGSIDESNRIIYGTVISRKSAVTPQENVNLLMQTGQFQVTSVSYHGIQYVIKARRK